MLITVIQVFEISFPKQGPRSIFEIGGGGGHIIDSILGGGHKTLFRTNSLKF